MAKDLLSEKTSNDLLASPISSAKPSLIGGNEYLKNQRIKKEEEYQKLPLPLKILATPGKVAGEFSSGIMKSIPSTIEGISTLAQKGAQKLGIQKGPIVNLFPEEITSGQTGVEKEGKFIGDVAQFVIPSNMITKLPKAASFLSKAANVGARALTSGAVATAQTGELGAETATAAGAEIALPIIGKYVLKPVVNLVGRLFKGLGSGLSGVSTDSLTAIVKDDVTSRAISKEIVNSGQERVLTRNVKTILDGVSKVRKEASAKFGTALERLAGKNINPTKISTNTVEALEKNGIKVVKDGVDMSSSEILDPLIQKRATNLINQINEQTASNGKNLWTLMKNLESSKFKSALDPNRKAFNNLVTDLYNGLTKAVSESSTTFGKMNASYSKDMQIAGVIQKIFGKVNFKNSSEILAISKKLENLFAQKGLSPQYIDDFLNRIGISPSKFRAGEATRQIMTKTTGANTKGISLGELMQQTTSAVVTPNFVKNVAVATGWSTRVIGPLLKNATPAERAVIIRALLGNPQQ